MSFEVQTEYLLLIHALCEIFMFWKVFTPTGARASLILYFPFLLFEILYTSHTLALSLQLNLLPTCIGLGQKHRDLVTEG